MANFTTFLDVNARFGKKPALVYPRTGFSCSFVELLHRVDFIAQTLLNAGISKGDPVCILLENCPDFICSYLAVWRIAAIAVPAHNVLKEVELLHILNDSGAIAVITDVENDVVIQHIKNDAPVLKHIILIDRILGPENFFPDQKSFRAVFCENHATCQIQYTSGTTGVPKGAMLSHGNWMAALEAERDVLNLSSDDIYLGIYPMAHVGVSWGIAALKAGATFVIMERFGLEYYLELIRKTGATVVAAMPPVIHSILESPRETEKTLDCVRIMISGGGPLHPSIWKAFHARFGVPILNAYGLSETIVVGTGTAIRPEDSPIIHEFRSVGRPVGYTEVKIVDVAAPKNEMKTGEIGEIALRGPGVAHGYWNLPDETAEVFRSSGWFLTGDVGYIEESGMLVISDRKKDMIVMSGWKIYPTEVEKVLIQHPKISDVAVFGVPDIHRGEVPVAAVVPMPGEEITFKELASYGREYLAGYKVPRKMIVMDELPRIHGWKLLRRALREKYGHIPE